MAAGLGSLTVDLLLETVQWVSGLNKAEAQAEKFADAIGQKFDAMGERALSALKGMAAGLVAGFAVERIAGFVNETQKAADALDEMAQKSGTSVAFLAQIGVTAGTAGSSVESIAASMGKFNKATTEAFADKSSQPAAIFRELGISVTDSAGKLKSSEALYQEFALALGNMEDGAIKSATAQAILGKSGAENIPTFNALARQSEELTAATAAYGEQMAKLAPVAGALEEQQARMATNSKTIAAVVGQELIPYFTELTKQWNDASASGGTLSNVGVHLVNAFKGIMIALDAVITTFSQLISVAVTGVSVLAKLAKGDLSGAFGEVKILFTDLASSSAAFEKRLDALVNPVNATTAAVHETTQASAGLAAAVAKVDDNTKKLAAEWKRTSDAWVKSIDDAIEAEKKLALAGAKAAEDRAKATEKEMRERAEALAKALTEEQKIMEEANKAAIKFRADEQAKALKEWESQWGGFYKGIEDAGRAAFDALFDGTKGGWDEMLTSLKQSFKRVLLDFIYQAFAKPILVRLAASMTGAPGGVGGVGGIGGGGMDWGKLAEGAKSAYDYFFAGGSGAGAGLDSLSWTSNASGMTGGLMSAGAGVVGGAFGGWAAGAYGAGERGQAAAQSYAATGAAIGMQVYGPIGAAVGAIIGTIAGIATDPDPDAMRKAVFGQISEHTQGVTKWTGESTFGKFGFSEGEWLSDEQMDESMSRAIAGIAQMDDALAGFMSEEQIERVKARLADAAKKYELGMEHLDVQGIGAIIKDRLAIITGEFHKGLSAFVAAFDGDVGDLTTIVTGFMQAMTMAGDFDVNAILESVRPRQMMDVYQEQRGSFEEFIPTVDASADSMNSLVSQMLAFQSATIEVIAAIDAAAASMHDMFMSTREKIEMSVMSPEERYNYLQAQTEELYRQLETETDPAQIQALAAKINANINAAWELLTPEQQQAMAESFTTRLTMLDEAVALKMGALREVVIEDAENVMTDITNRLEAVFGTAEAAAAAQQQAAAAQQAAADTPHTVVVVVSDDGTVKAAG